MTYDKQDDDAVFQRNVRDVHPSGVIRSSDFPVKANGRIDTDAVEDMMGRFGDSYTVVVDDQEKMQAWADQVVEGMRAYHQKMRSDPYDLLQERVRRFENKQKMLPLEIRMGTKEAADWQAAAQVLFAVVATAAVVAGVIRSLGS